MMQPMTASRALRRWTPLGFVVLAMGGTIAGHAAVWSLVGGASPGLASARSIHNYLRPIGLALVLLAACASWAVWRALRILDTAAARFRRSLRHPPAMSPPRISVAPGGVPAWPALWVTLAAVQLCVYTVQENIEAHAAHVALPGVRVLTAHHGVPILVHAVVALAITGLVSLVAGALGRRHRSVERIVRLLHAVTARRGLVRAPALAPQGAPMAPRVRFGLSFVSRPPPFVVG
jgi:hypothetical protein